MGGAPRASGTVHAVGSLLAAGLLVGLVRRAPLVALGTALFGSTVVVVGTPDTLYGSAEAAYQGQFLAYLAGGDALAVNAVIALLAMAACCMAGLLSRERREHAVALRTQEVAEAVTAERLRIA